MHVILRICLMLKTDLVQSGVVRFIYLFLRIFKIIVYIHINKHVMFLTNSLFKLHYIVFYWKWENTVMVINSSILKWRNKISTSLLKIFHDVDIALLDYTPCLRTIFSLFTSHTIFSLPNREDHKPSSVTSLTYSHMTIFHLISSC